MPSRNDSVNSVFGVALLEVLMSVTIVGLGLGAAMQTFSSVTRSQSRIEERAEARMLVTRTLMQLRVTISTGRMEEERGDFETPYSAYRWRATAEQVGGSVPYARVSVTIEKREESRAVYRIQTFVYIG